MILSLAEKIRKLAALIERDNTPSEGTIQGHSMINSASGEEDDTVKKKKLPAPKQEAPLKPTAPSQQRRPRKMPDHKNKWNTETKTGLMNEYMKEYRAQGRDKEVSGLKSTYHKKFTSK